MTVKTPPLPAYDEGHIESVGEGSGLGRDENRNTGAGAPDRSQAPKLSDQKDAFVSSEVAEELEPGKTG